MPHDLASSGRLLMPQPTSLNSTERRDGLSGSSGLTCSQGTTSTSVLSCSTPPLADSAPCWRPIPVVIYDQSKAVFEYFGLPIDAEPPV